MKPNTKTSYQAKLLDPRWQKMRLDVFARDEWKCTCCEAGDKTLNAHHTFYRRDAAGPWDYELDTIVTLCVDCHEAEHEGFYEARDELIENVIRMGFVTTSRIGDLAGTLAGTPMMSSAELGAFMAAIRKALQSREWKLAFDGDGAVWEEFLKLGEAP